MPHLRPLGKIELGCWLVDQAAPMNVVAIAHVRGPLDVSRLRPALALVQRRHPLLQVSIQQQGGAAVYASDTAAIPLVVSARQDSTHWQRVAVEERNRPIRWNVAPLVQVTVLHGESESEILVTLHHVICDGFSSVYFLRDLLTALSSAPESAKAETLPLRPALETLFPDSLRGLSGLRSSARHLWAQARALFALRPRLLSEQTPVPMAERRSGLAHHLLTSEETAALIASCRSHGVTVHGALCAALLMAVAAELRAESHLESPVLGCCTPVNLRRTLTQQVDDEIGLFVGPVVTFHRIAAAMPLFELAAQVTKEVHAGRAEGAPSVALMTQTRLLPPRLSPQQAAKHICNPLFGTVSVTNLGALDIPTHYAALQLDSLHFSPANNPYGSLISLSVTTLSGRLCVNFNYNEKIVSAERLARVVAATLRALRSPSPS